MTSVCLLLHYTDVIEIAATTVGTLVLVVRVFDGFADLFGGRVVDTRWRRFRPYLLLFVPIPLVLGKIVPEVAQRRVAQQEVVR
jgi:Na+/melibiose symporter-like transporter